MYGSLLVPKVPNCTYVLLTHYLRTNHKSKSDSGKRENQKLWLKINLSWCSSRSKIDLVCWMIAIQIHTFVLCNLTVLFPDNVRVAWLQFVCMSERTFSGNILLLEFSSPSNCSFPILPAGKQMMHRWSRKEVEWNQGWPIRRADKLSANRLSIALRYAAWKEATCLSATALHERNQKFIFSMFLIFAITAAASASHPCSMYGITPRLITT